MKKEPIVTTEQSLAFNEALLQEVLQLGSATLHEASGERGALPWYIKPICPDFRLAGRAVTVLCPGGDNLWIHRAIYQTGPGDVLVVDVGDSFEFGYWGEVMTHAAIAQGIAGYVTNGCVRDSRQLGELGFPVFARGQSIRGTGKDRNSDGAINVPVRLGDTVVRPGDLIVGDRDGVVVIAQKNIEETVVRARARQQKEEHVIEALQRGERTLEIYGLD